MLLVLELRGILPMSLPSHHLVNVIRRAAPTVWYATCCCFPTPTSIHPSIHLAIHPPANSYRQTTLLSIPLTYDRNAILDAQLRFAFFRVFLHVRGE